MESSTRIPNLSAIATEFKDRIDLQSRKYRLKNYTDTFVGVDAITLLLSILKPFGSHDRREAELVGRELADRFKLFHHVTKEHKLADDYYVYVMKDSPISETTEEENRIFFDKLKAGELKTEEDEEGEDMDEFHLDMVMESLGTLEWLPQNSASSKRQRYAARRDQIVLLVPCSSPIN